MANLLAQELRVIDGDTYVENGARKRLYGGNAPEIGEGGSAAATNFLADELAKNPKKEKVGEGFYGRDLVNLNSGDVVESGIRKGYLAPNIGDNARFQDAGRDYINRVSTGPDPEITPPDQLAVDEHLIEQRLLNSDVSTSIRNQRSQRLYNKNGAFTGAVARGTDNLQSLGYSAVNAGAKLLGDIVGTDVMDSWGEEGLRSNMVDAAMNPAKIESWDNVNDLGTFFTYAVEALGEQVPNIVSMALSGGVGGAVAKQAVKASIAKKVMQNALTHSNALQLSRMAGQRGVATGVAGISYGMGVGDIQQELTGAGIDSPGTAFVGAVPYAALETLGFQHTIGRLFKGIDSDIATQSIKSIAKSVFKATGVGAAAESSTEMLQEIVSLSAHAYHDPTFDIFSEVNLQRIKEAGIKAGIVGGVSAGGVTTVNKVGGKLLSPPPKTDPVETAPPETNPAEEGLDRVKFAARERDYGYIPEEAVVKLQDVYEGIDATSASPEETAPLRHVLEKEVDPQLDNLEAKITINEALRKCLGS